MKSKVLIILGILLAASMILTACAQKEAVETEQGEVQENVVAPTSEPEKDEPPEEIELVVYDAWAVESIINPVMEEYEKLHPNVTIIRQPVNYTTFLEDLQVLWQGNAPVDVIIANPDSYLDVASFNLLLDLTELVDYWDRFNLDLYSQYFEVPGARYAVPGKGSFTYNWVINTTLWDKYDCSYPTDISEALTYEEYKECGDRMIADGIIPFGVCGTYTPTFGSIAEATLGQVADDPVKVTTDTVAGRMSFTDEIWVHTWEDALLMISDGLVGDINDVLGCDEAVSTAAFMSSESAATGTGNWSFGAFTAASDENPDFQWTVIRPPIFPHAKEENLPPRHMMFPSAYVGIWSKSEHVPEALELIDMLSTDEMEEAWMDLFHTATHMNVNSQAPFELSDNNEKAIATWNDGFIQSGYMMGIQLYEVYFDEFAKVAAGEQSIEEGLANVEAWTRENQDLLPKY